MKTLTAIIVSGIFALSATACTCNSGLFGGKTVKASRNYVTKNIKVDNFTGLNLVHGSGSHRFLFRSRASLAGLHRPHFGSAFPVLHWSGDITTPGIERSTFCACIFSASA